MPGCEVDRKWDLRRWDRCAVTRFGSGPSLRPVSGLIRNEPSDTAAQFGYVSLAPRDEVPVGVGGCLSGRLTAVDVDVHPVAVQFTRESAVNVTCEHQHPHLFIGGQLEVVVFINALTERTWVSLHSMRLRPGPTFMPLPGPRWSHGARRSPHGASRNWVRRTTA